MMTSPLTADAVQVFISYSHDSLEHKRNVLMLVNRLRESGVDSHVDQYEMSPPEGWPRWMRNQVEAAKYVLVVCTATYERRFEGKEEPGPGQGSTWEGGVITQELYEAHGKNAKFIPVYFDSEDRRYIPIVLRGTTGYQVTGDEGYWELYRRLTNQPLAPKPPLGSLTVLAGGVQGSSGDGAFDYQRIEKRVLDPFFVPDDAYARKVVSEIPEQQRVNCFKKLFSYRHRVDTRKNLRHSLRALARTMTAGELAQVATLYSPVLESESSLELICDAFITMDPVVWPHLPPDLRVRLENLVLSCLEKGTWSSSWMGTGYNWEGAVGSFSITYGQFFKDQRRLVGAILGRLSNNWNSQNYVAVALLPALPALIKEHVDIQACCKKLAYACLVNEAHSLMSKLGPAVKKFPEQWRQLLASELSGVAVEKNQDWRDRTLQDIQGGAS